MPRPTLRRRLSLLLLQWIALYLVAAAVVSALLFVRARDEAVEQRLLLARTVARYLDSTLTATHHDLGSLAAELPALDERALPRLRSFRFQSAFRDAIFLVDADGGLLAADPSWAVPPPVRWFDGRPRVTPLLERPDGGEPALVLVEPFHRDGRTWHLAVRMRPLGSPVSAFLQDLGLGDDLEVAVADDDGRVLAAADHELLGRRLPQAAEWGERPAGGDEPWVGRSAVCTLCEDQRRGSYLTLRAPLRQAPWGVVVQQSGRRAFATLYGVEAGAAGTALLLVLMAGLLFRALSRSVVAPIRALSRQAEALRRGDLDAPIAVAGDREIAVLAGTFEAARRRLAATLGELTALAEGLEAQVAARTAELAERDDHRRALVRRLLAAGEEERRRIARELHDEISQLLTVIQLSLDRAGVDTAELGEARRLLDRTQREVHRVIFDLRPSLLDDLGLAAAVRWYARNYLQPAGIDVRLEVVDDLAVPAAVEITAFRIYQEIVTNILRHAGAETVSVELYCDGETLVLGVEDDGVGFDAAAAGGEGVGIAGMRERAELVGGALAIDSEPGLGTHVRLAIPLADWREAAA